MCALYLLFYKIAEWETDDCNTRLISLLNCPIYFDSGADKRVQSARAWVEPHS